MNFRILLNSCTRVSYSTGIIPFATKTIIKQPNEVPFVVGIMTVEILCNLFDYCCSPFQTILINPKRLSLDKVMRTKILVSSSRLET